MNDLTNMVSKHVDSDSVIAALRKLADHIDAEELVPTDYKVTTYELTGTALISLKVARTELTIDSDALPIIGNEVTT